MLTEHIPFFRRDEFFGVVAPQAVEGAAMANAGARPWGRFCGVFGLALVACVAPALADDVLPPRDGRTGVGMRVNPFSIILPAIGDLATQPRPTSAPPPDARPARAPRAPLRVHRGSPPGFVAPAPPFVARAFPPPLGETRFRRAEALVEILPATPPATVALIARRHRLIEAEVVPIGLLGTSVRLWRIPDARDVASVVRELGFEPSLVSVQPNYIYAAQQDAAPTSAPSPPQYALARLHVDAIADPPPAEPVRVAVIDTAIDESHPDLEGAIEARFDAIGGAAPHTLEHGTAIAGAIAARGRLKGVDPNVRILAARAFDSEGAGPMGETLWLLKAIDWAAGERASVVNMSFAGPPDPALHAILAAAFAKGMTLVAAAGNAGPKSPPLYPAADETALAVTATDADDKLYPKANAGRYVAVAAPGVDVLLPAPQASYALETGTSVSAALVSGVVALMLERRAAATPAEIRKWLTATAEPLGRGGGKDEFGAGLVDAERAVAAAAAASPQK